MPTVKRKLSLRSRLVAVKQHGYVMRSSYLVHRPSCGFAKRAVESITISASAALKVPPMYACKFCLREYRNNWGQFRLPEES